MSILFSFLFYDFFFGIELYDLLVYFTNFAPVGCSTYRYFLWFCRVVFFFLMVFFTFQRFIRLIGSVCLFFIQCFSLWGWSKKILLQFIPEHVLHLFFYMSFMVSFLVFQSWSRFEFSLFMVGGNVQTSSFYLWLSYFPSTTCWGYSPFSRRVYIFPLFIKD